MRARSSFNDDDKARHVAQTQLPGNFARRFQIGGDRRLFDAMLARRPARVDVDRYERFRRIDDQIAARLQLHDRIIHRGELVLDAKALEQRHGVSIIFHPARMAGHQQLHEVLRCAIAFFAFDDHFLDILVIDIADSPLDEVAVVVDQLRRGSLQGLFANFVPQTREIVEVAANFRLGARQTGGAHDAAHG